MINSLMYVLTFLWNVLPFLGSCLPGHYALHHWKGASKTSPPPDHSLEVINAWVKILVVHLCLILLWTALSQLSTAASFSSGNLIAIHLGFPLLHTYQGRLYYSPEGGGDAHVAVWQLRKKNARKRITSKLWQFGFSNNSYLWTTRALTHSLVHTDQGSLAHTDHSVVAPIKDHITSTAQCAFCIIVFVEIARALFSLML